MNRRIAAAIVLMLAAGTVAHAQLNLRNLKDAAKKGLENVAGNNNGTVNNSGSPVPATKGKTFYVSATTGSARADGLSATSAMKDLQKAINTAEDDDIILVAEGNYLGNLDRGYIECGRFGNSSQASDRGKFISIYGGYAPDFSERDIIKYVTKLQPTDQKFIAPLFNMNARRPYGYNGPEGNVVIDGLVFDFGENNLYCAADVKNEITGTPNEGVLTGRFVEPDAAPNCPKVGYANGDEYGLHMDVEGNVRVSNCIFVNCRDYGISALMGKGHMEVCNNIFIACRYAACQVKGNVRDADIPLVSLDFHHNTVLFTWTRTKAFEDMGQGFRFMNGIRTINVHNNIFGCNSNCAVERVYYESNKAMEAAKESNLYDNYFFANRRDLEIASSGVASISVPAARIEEAEQIGPKYEGNMEMPEGNDEFLKAIDQPYLEGFLTLKIMSNQSYNANSAANQANRMFGLNQQGTEIVRPSMYCNKYPWEKAKDLFGKVNNYGAQLPK
ncbi:MAG: right-handed parallel beta-helix repeat-containing protein [Bacteroidales bacterium]|nr:right-handed parallel beta-helix repeat-containing protein [Bacteroidales bacterium]